MQTEQHGGGGTPWRSAWCNLPEVSSSHSLLLAACPPSTLDSSPYPAGTPAPPRCRPSTPQHQSPSPMGASDSAGRAANRKWGGISFSQRCDGCMVVFARTHRGRQSGFTGPHTGPPPRPGDHPLLSHGPLHARPRQGPPPGSPPSPSLTGARVPSVRVRPFPGACASGAP